MTTAAHTRDSSAAWQGLTVFERGWLSCNNVLLHSGADGPGAVLIDSGHTLHAEQTVALLQQALHGRPLTQVINTHLHSDHCGGNAAVQRHFGCRIVMPPGDWAAARVWDESRLSYRATGQTCERFVPDAVLQPGSVLTVGTRRWQVLAAPGHDPHAVMLFDAQQGVLISADALWENGFGVVFPELDGAQAFDVVAQTLDLIESLDARWVVPGHGAVFGGEPGAIGAALGRARQRLAGFIARPERHARHAVRVLLKYHLLEVQSADEREVLDWFDTAPLCRSTWQRIGEPGRALREFGSCCLNELVGSGALLRQGSRIANA
ncbi:MAG: MBL fold metallo-hydrolase [Rubrivivax sp.]|nr:MBL fold metallo-hydrolase [Rubrivivax sp.]